MWPQPARPPWQTAKTRPSERTLPVGRHPASGAWRRKQRPYAKTIHCCNLALIIYCGRVSAALGPGGRHRPRQGESRREPAPGPAGHADRLWVAPADTTGSARAITLDEKAPVPCQLIRSRHEGLTGRPGRCKWIPACRAPAPSLRDRVKMCAQCAGRSRAHGSAIGRRSLFARKGKGA